MKPIELFQALERGEKIEFSRQAYDDWHTWDGKEWSAAWYYRTVKPEPKLVPHWPAVRHSDGIPFTTNSLYATEEQARGEWTEGFIRLATEYPPIMLEVKE